MAVKKSASTRPPTSRKCHTFVLDTSVLLADPAAVTRFHEHEVVIPVVVITELEHHANFVPWQFVAKKTGAEFAHIPIDDLGELQLDHLDEIAARGNVKVVANNLVSNTLGTINPVEKLAAWAHEQGAIMVVDAAQAAPHRHIDVQALGCDFLAFSSHKLCGPSGVGALWGKRELLEEMQPFNLGGEMIRSVALERTSWNELQYKFEADEAEKAAGPVSKDEAARRATGS